MEILKKELRVPSTLKRLVMKRNRGQEGTTRSTLDFSGYNEGTYLIQNAIESIVGNDGYNQEEQEHLWRQFFHQYQYDMDIVQSVLEEMDVYIFNKPSNSLSSFPC